MRRVSLGLVLLIAVILCVGCGRKEKPTVRGEIIIEDYASLLTLEEEALLRVTMNRLTEYGNVAFITTSISRGTTDYFAMSQYSRLFGTESGILFIIDMQQNWRWRRTIRKLL